MQAKKPQPSTVEVPSPVRRLPIVASATSSSLFDRPERTSTSPVRMNSGMAISAKASMPENSASPNRVSGSTSVETSSAIAQMPSDTHTGTAMANSSTMRSSGKPIAQPSSVEASGIPYMLYIAGAP